MKNPLNRKLWALNFQVIGVRNRVDWCCSGDSREKDPLHKYKNYSRINRYYDFKGILPKSQI